MTVPSVDSMLIAGRAVFLVFSFIVAAVTFSGWRRAARAQNEQALSQHDIVLRRLAELESRIDATRVCLERLGEHIDRPRQLAPAGGSASPGYEIAIRLAKGGASREELVSGCGLSLSEAELVWRLHSPRGASYRLKSA